jgi:hypothetical protein
MSEWLLCAGDEPAARWAAAAAHSLPGVRPGEHPFLRALVARDLQSALDALRDQPNRP